MLAGGSVLPTRAALYADPALVAKRPHMPAFRDLATSARPRPVTPAYLMLSTSLQPEVSAAVVGVKSPARAVADARHQLEHALSGLDRHGGPRNGPPNPISIIEGLGSPPERGSPHTAMLVTPRRSRGAPR